MSGQMLAQMPHWLQVSGCSTKTLPVSERLKTPAGQNVKHSSQCLHHASKMSIGSVLIRSGKGVFFFRTEGPFTVPVSVTVLHFSERGLFRDGQEPPPCRGRVNRGLDRIFTTHTYAYFALFLLCITPPSSFHKRFFSLCASPTFSPQPAGTLKEAALDRVRSTPLRIRFARPTTLRRMGVLASFPELAAGLPNWRHPD